MFGWQPLSIKTSISCVMVVRRYPAPPEWMGGSKLEEFLDLWSENPEEWNYRRYNSGDERCFFNPDHQVFLSLFYLKALDQRRPPEIRKRIASILLIGLMNNSDTSFSSGDSYNLFRWKGLSETDKKKMELLEMGEMGLLRFRLSQDERLKITQTFEYRNGLRNSGIPMISVGGGGQIRNIPFDAGEWVMGCISTMKEISDSFGLPNGWKVGNSVSEPFLNVITLEGMVENLPNVLDGWQAPYRSALVDTFYWFDPFAEDKITSNFIYSYNYYRGLK